MALCCRGSGGGGCVGIVASDAGECRKKGVGGGYVVVIYVIAARSRRSNDSDNLLVTHSPSRPDQLPRPHRNASSESVPRVRNLPYSVSERARLSNAGTHANTRGGAVSVGVVRRGTITCV